MPRPYVGPDRCCPDVTRGYQPMKLIGNSGHPCALTESRLSGRLPMRPAANQSDVSASVAVTAIMSAGAEPGPPAWLRLLAGGPLITVQAWQRLAVLGAGVALMVAAAGSPAQAAPAASG